ncbi:hypothetical protein WICMUC_000401 [Wickerhamomyces mucosus]|uniref:ML-like domain-containing protein n=1 Tax=Wickerhamomyces mucosus TaxID=1378264 RepID=A0A9P8Q002_9ASCO|nr:hypothetical protein WICMUC_000401 [Wickerhamomyces mucosus]
MLSKIRQITLVIFLSLLTLTNARSLSASSLVTCMEDSQLVSTYFDVVFNPDDGSLHYTLDFTSEIDSYIIAEIDVYAYGFKIISRTLDLCSLNWKQFCPLYPGDVDVDSVEYISSKYTDLIPGISYTVPDIDAFARVNVLDTNGTRLACLQAYFTNGKTVSQSGVKWATAVVAGLGLLTSAIASTFGNSNAASHVSANAVSLFLYFQSVVVVSMQHVDEVPPIAAAWSENLIWSMGLIRVSFMQKIFRWYVESTGGTPTLYLTSTTISILVQRSLEYSKTLAARGLDLIKRASPVVIYGNSNTLIFRGIERLAYRAGIELTSVVPTGFTFFILCAYVLIGVIFIFKYGSELCVRAGWLNPNKFYEFRTNWKIILKGSLSRYIYIGFTQLIILSLWEFVRHDSPAVITLAVLFLLLAIGILAWSLFRTIIFAKTSIREYQNPAYLLYGDEKVLNKYGFIYTMFNANRYWWGAVLLTHTFIKCFFIGLAQSSGKTQAIVIWIVDMVYLGLLIHFWPYLNSPTNWVNVAIQVVTTINSFLFTFFSNIFGQPAAVGSIMGWVFFLLNAAFSFILLVSILVFSGWVLFSKNPDTRFKPAKDDRTSFQRYSHHPGQKGPTAELLALGLTAQDHKDNWEKEIQDLQNKEKESKDISTTSEDDKLDDGFDKDESFAGKVARKLSLGKSFKRNKSQRKSKENTTLLSDEQNNNEVNLDKNDDVLNFDNTLQGHRKDESISSFHYTSNNAKTLSTDFIAGRPGSDESYSKF